MSDLLKKAYLEEEVGTMSVDRNEIDRAIDLILSGATTRDIVRDWFSRYSATVERREEERYAELMGRAHSEGVEEEPRLRQRPRP